MAVTLSEGGHTCDVPGAPLSTTAFADRVIANLGRSLPGHLARAANPFAGGETNCVDHWSGRFVARGTQTVNDATITALMGRVGSK